MVYYFVDVPKQKKRLFIRDSAFKLIEKLQIYYGKKVNYDCIKDELEELVACNNLRDIKRKIEDIVFQEFFKTEIQNGKKMWFYVKIKIVLQKVCECDEKKVYQEMTDIWKIISSQNLRLSTRWTHIIIEIKKKKERHYGESL